MQQRDCQILNAVVELCSLELMFEGQAVQVILSGGVGQR
jgi:hypothetical protein